MLFDHRFERDAALARQVMAVAEDAIAFYKECIASADCTAARFKYEEVYRENISQLGRLVNVYMGAEWSRLQTESETGRKVSFKEWERLYDEGMENYQKWSDA